MRFAPDDATHWLLCCFDCGLPTRAIIGAVRPAKAGENVRETARESLARHHTAHSHTDVFILCAQRSDGSYVTVLPELLMDPERRAATLSHAATLGALYAQRYQAGAENPTCIVHLPTLELVETLDTVRDLITAYQGATDSDLA